MIFVVGYNVSFTLKKQNCILFIVIVIDCDLFAYIYLFIYLCGVLFVYLFVFVCLFVYLFIYYIVIYFSIIQMFIYLLFHCLKAGCSIYNFGPRLSDCIASFKCKRIKLIKTGN